MEIVYFSEGNFGDDLNRIIWPEILSARLRDEPDLALLGIGSLINDSFVAPIMRSGRRLIILGSGAEYGRLPSCMGEVEVLAVRGPLTAEVIGRPSSAITDGAILLADTSHGKPGTRTKDVVFMPHFQTSKDGHLQ